MIDLYELVRKLNGSIKPVGMSHIDSTNYKNLENIIGLIEQLFFDLNNVAKYKDRPEYSMSKAGKKADECLRGLKIMLEELP